MRILKINTPGFINLTGVSPRRTPAEIDITKCNINTILTELRKYGINDFIIENKSDKTIKIEKTKEEIKENDNLQLNNKEFYKNNNIEEKIDNLESLLKNLLENKDTNIKINTKNNYEDEKMEDDDNDEDFIPDIDLSGLKLNK